MVEEQVKQFSDAVYFESVMHMYDALECVVGSSIFLLPGGAAPFHRGGDAERLKKISIYHVAPQVWKNTTNCNYTDLKYTSLSLHCLCSF